MGHAGGFNSVTTLRAMDVRFGFGGSRPIMQMEKAVKQYDLVFPVARVWAAFSEKTKKELMTKKEVKAMSVTSFQ